MIRENRNKPGNENIADHPPKQKPKENTLLADNYQPFPAFESLIGTHIRSGYFRLINPKESDHVSEKKAIGFTWETGITQELTLRIMDNTGTAVFESQPTTLKGLEVPVGKLKNGLYYFKMMEGSQIIFFGKFYLDKQS